MYATIRSYLLARIETELGEESSELEEEVEITTSEPEFRQRFQHRYTEETIFGFQVARVDGTVLFGTPWLRDVPLPRPDIASGDKIIQRQDIPLSSGQRMRLLGRRIETENGPFLIYVAAPLGEVDSQLRTLTLLLAMNGLAAVLSAVVVGYFMARRVLTPIQTITDISRRVTSEHLAERVPVSNPKDELGQLSITLNDTFGRLQRSIDELRRFTADAAHELRTPLTIIRTEVEVALRELDASGEKSPEPSKRMTNIVLAESGRLTILVEQLLTLSRCEAGLDRVSFEEISLRELLLDVIETLGTVADKKGVKIDVSGLSSHTVVGDDISLSQLFFNLIDNAIRYTPSGGTVTVQMDGEPSVVRVTVSDTGIGIDQKHLNHVFERFYRVESSRTGGGTGLGLAICHSIVTAHDGTIRVQSELGRGTRFAVELPATS